MSPAGDWSQVKVWYAPTGDLGTTVYPTKGFIYADAAASSDAVKDEAQQAMTPAQKTGIANVIALAASQKF